jgi:spore maturation protein A
MLGKVFGTLCLIAFAFGFATGHWNELGSAVLDGASAALDVTLSLCGMMCLWCGFMRVLSEAGVIRRLSRILRPLLRPFFPNAAQSGEGLEEISANLSANLLGIGNAATPFALSAMKKLLLHNPTKTKASDEEITLAVMNTASLTLIPANLLALRRAAGSCTPYAVLIPIWITSATSLAMALFLTSLPRILRKITRKGKSNDG